MKLPNNREEIELKATDYYYNHVIESTFPDREVITDSYVAGAEEMMENLDTFAIQFAVWLFENRWFYYDKETKKWSYTFEQGTSISKETYSKHYKKTTEELLSVFRTG